MRILAVADVEEAWLGSQELRRRLEGIDLIVSCGDLRASYLEFIADMARVPVAYVPGNHDSSYASRPPEGCVCLDGELRDYHGLRLMGLGGSVWYSNGSVGYTESEMGRRAARLVLLAQATGGVDLVVTHAPVAGYGDLDDRVHKGFACFDTMLERLQPGALVHGHVHTSYGRVARRLEHPSGALIVNACGSQVFDLEPADHRRGLFKAEKL